MFDVIPFGEQSHKFSLASEVLRRFGKLRLQVTGGSMLPALWPGDLLVIHSARVSDLSPGDLALFARDGRFFVHRVTAISETGVTTQGEALVAPDPPVSSDELLGRVVGITRGGSRRTPAPQGVAGRMLSFAARHSTLFCTFLLRLRSLYRRLRRLPALAGVFFEEAAWRS